MRQVARVHLLRDCVEGGQRISTLVHLSDAQLRHLARRDTASEVQIQKLISLVAEMKVDELEASLGLHLLTMGTILFVEELVVPVMEEVGKRWENGSIPVAAEHLLTASVRNLLVSTLRLAGRRGSKKRVMFATLDGEHHEIGLLSSALIMVNHGVDPLYLGTGVPAKEVACAASKTGAVTVVIGSTMADADLFAEILLDVRRQLPQQISIIAGGKPATHIRWQTIEGVAAFDSMSGLNDYMKRGGFDAS